MVRGIYFNEAMAKLGALAPQLLELAREELPAEAFGPVSPLGWVPVEWTNAVESIVLRELGEEALVELYRASTATAGTHPLYTVLWRSAARWLGPGTASVLSWLPAAYKVTTKNLGVATSARHGAGVRLTVAHVPEPFGSFAGMRPCIRGTLLGLLDMLGQEGEVACHDDGAGIHFDLRWRPHAAVGVPAAFD